jgi:amino acid transporter
MDTAINILIFVITAISLLFCFCKAGRWDLQKGLKSLRFFTILSNLFCAVSALLLVLSLSQWAWLLKYVGTVAVTITLLTVLFFLGPNMG